MSKRDKSERDKPEQDEKLLLDKETLRDLNLDEETAGEVKGGARLESCTVSVIRPSKQ